MYVAIILQALVLILILFNIKIGIHKSQTRLINLKYFPETIKWKLITRLGP